MPSQTHNITALQRENREQLDLGKADVDAGGFVKIQHLFHSLRRDRSADKLMEYAREHGYNAHKHTVTETTTVYIYKL